MDELTGDFLGPLLSETKAKQMVPSKGVWACKPQLLQCFSGPVTKITGMTDTGHQVSRWIHRWCLYRRGTPWRHTHIDQSSMITFRFTLSNPDGHICGSVDAANKHSAVRFLREWNANSQILDVVPGNRVAGNHLPATTVLNWFHAGRLRKGKLPFQRFASESWEVTVVRFGFIDQCDATWICLLIEISALVNS